MKITKATLKSFLKRTPNLQINVLSSFDGMRDGVARHDCDFVPLEGQFNEAEKNTLGFRGVWLVNSSRDYIKPYAKDGMHGFEVFNSCGSFVVARKT